MSEIVHANNESREIILSDEKQQRKPFTNQLLWFFVITFVWSWSLFLPAILATYNIILLPGYSQQILSGFALFGSMIAATIIIGINKGKVGLFELFKKMINFKYRKIWFLPIFLVPILSAGAAFLIAIGAFGFTLEDNYYNIGFIVGAVVIAFFVGGPLAEELGWRGFALDKIQKKFNALFSSIFIGAIWSLWHLPLHFIEGTTQYYIPIWAFFLMNTTQTIFYTWIYNNTNGSVFATILLHWAGNIAGALLPYWQIGIIQNVSENNRLWLPTYGMLIGYAITLSFAIVVVVLFNPKKFVITRDL